LDGNSDKLAKKMDVSNTGLLTIIVDKKIIDRQQRDLIEVSISVFCAFTYHFAFCFTAECQFL